MFGRYSFFLILLLHLYCATPCRTQEKATQELLITDGSGKEHRLSSWKFVEGSKEIDWVRDNDLPLQTLRFVEGKGSLLKNHVTTFVPIKSVQSLNFDEKKNTVKLTILGHDKKELILEGPLGYVGVNVFAVETTTEVDDLGKAKFKFQGGVPRGIRSIRFPNPMPLEFKAKDPLALIRTLDRQGNLHNVSNPQALYMKQNRSEVLRQGLHFEETIKIALNKLAKMIQVGNGGRQLVYDVTLPSGWQKPLVLRTTHTLTKKQTEFFVGLVGECETGYKLFPMPSITAIYIGDHIPKK